MANTPSMSDDPLEGMSLAGFAGDLRAGRRSSEAITRAYLDRIARLDGVLGSYQHVAAESALRSARAIDNLLAAGTDLGPLMGVPVAVKDIFSVEGMPTTVGSQLDLEDLLEAEGPVVRQLRQAGCVILGKTKTVEFAFGPAGTNAVRGTPQNPWDAAVARLPGGSSSGSAVAVAAGLCAFALGSDTGGSIRLPAALCGVFGLKTTVGRWSTQGVFPLSPTLDSVGILSRSAQDAALIYAAVSGRDVVSPAAVDSLRLGWFPDYFFADLDPDVEAYTIAAIELLKGLGAITIERRMANLEDRARFNGTLVPAELLATLGRSRFDAERERMDPVVAHRLSAGLDLKADEYIALLRAHERMKAVAEAEMQDLDGWLAPTCAAVALPVERAADIAQGAELARRLTRNTGPMNMFGQCGTSTPVQSLIAPLPVGLQVTCRPFQEERALSIALALERVVGPPRMPDISAFTDQSPAAGPTTTTDLSPEN
jgi:aspartyl-tRNA(Asn)/glutamyl-tRNA(Gln) amidotransferase subunit A